MESIDQLLSERVQKPPPNVRIIINFVKSRYGLSPTVLVRRDRFIIVVPNAALAADLQLRLPEIQRICPSCPHLSIRLGLAE